MLENYITELESDFKSDVRRTDAFNGYFKYAVVRFLTDYYPPSRG